MDKQRGRPGADRVLRLLPRAVAAHPPLRAAPGTSATPPTACASSRSTRRASTPAATRTSCATPSRAWASSTRSASTPSSRSGGSTTTRAGPPATCSTADSRLAHFHYGEGGYAETEEVVQELLGSQREPLGPLRPEDDPEALIVVPTPEQPGAYAGPYEAGGVWAVLSGAGDGHRRRPRARRRRTRAPTRSSSTPRHTAGVLDLDVGDGVSCHATCFTPGLAPG